MPKNDLRHDHMPQLVLRLALPTMLAQFVNVLYSIVDRMFIGHIPHLGTAALAGVGVCGPIIAVLYSFAYLIGQGGTPLMAMALGAKKPGEATAILSTCYRLLLLLGGILTVLFWGWERHFLWWFGVSARTLPHAMTFLTIYIGGTTFALLSGGLNSFLIAQGRAGLGVGTVLIGALLNVSLDPILIFCLGWGVAGAAISTVISQVVSSGFTIYCLRHLDLPVTLTWGRWRPDLCRQILTLGLAPFLTYALDSSLLILLNATLQRTGGPGEGDLLVTCATIVQSYMLLITSPLSGITLGCQGIVSFNLGARNAPRVRQALWWVYLVCLGFCTIMGLVTLLATPLFTHLFTTDPTILHRSVPYIKLYSAGVLCMAAQWTVTDMGTALGKMKMALTCSLIRKGIYVLGVLGLPRLIRPDAAFAAQPLCDVVASVVSLLIFWQVVPRLLKQKRENGSKVRELVSR